MNSADGVYDHTKGRPIVGDRNDVEPRYDYLGPYKSIQDSLISRALAAVTTPGAVLQEIVRPNLPQVKLFPPRFGYRSRELNLKDVMHVNEDTNGFPLRADTYGTASAESTMRNAQGQGFW